MLYSVYVNSHKEFDIYLPMVENILEVDEVLENIETSVLKFAYSLDGRFYSDYYDNIDDFIGDIKNKENVILRLNVCNIKNDNLDKTLYGFDVLVDGTPIERSMIKTVRVIRNSDILNTFKTPNLYNPYRLSEKQKVLQNKMSKSMSDIFGFDVTWFKTTHNLENSSATFREYTFGEVKEQKTVRIVVKNNYIPDNRTRFGEFDLDFQDELEIHIDKTVFDCVFPNEIPNSDDFFFFPLTNRMYTINTPYNEKNFMQNDPFWKMTCVKYENRNSVKKPQFINDEINELVSFDYEFEMDAKNDEKLDTVLDAKPIDEETQNNISECFVSYGGQEVFNYYYNFVGDGLGVVKEYKFEPKKEFTFLGWFNLTNKTQNILNLDELVILKVEDGVFKLRVETDNLLPTQYFESEIDAILDEWFGVVVSYNKTNLVVSFVDCKMQINDSIVVNSELITNPLKLSLYGETNFANIRINKKYLTENKPLSFKDKLIEKTAIYKENFIIDNAVPSLTDIQE